MIARLETAILTRSSLATDPIGSRRSRLVRSPRAMKLWSVLANYREARLSDLYEEALVVMFLNLLVLKFD